MTTTTSKIIDETNAGAGGFGRIMEVVGSVYRDDTDPNPATRDTRFFPGGAAPLGWSPIEPATLRFHEHVPGGVGRAQYVSHKWRNWAHAKVVS